MLEFVALLIAMQKLVFSLKAHFLNSSCENLHKLKFTTRVHVSIPGISLYGTKSPRRDIFVSLYRALVS